MTAPKIIYGGDTALRHFGWLRWPVPPPRLLLVRDENPVVETPPACRVELRSADWFDKVLKHGDAVYFFRDDFPVLKPAWALADALQASGGWIRCSFKQNDLDIDFTEHSDENDWLQACGVFGIQLGLLHSQFFRNSRFAEAQPCKSF